MNKYLIFLLFVFFGFNAFALVPVQDMGTYTKAVIYDRDNINFTEIRDTVAYRYEFANSVVFIDDFSDWQKWDTKVSLDPIVSLYINNLDNSIANEKVRYLFLTPKS